MYVKGANIRILLTIILLPLLSALPAGPGWGRSRISRRERIARAERWEHVRLALRSAAAHGYYVFDDLMTEEAGMIDFLAVGPMGPCVVVVRDEPGTVVADVDATLYVDGRSFSDDPRRQAEELEEVVYAKLGEGEYTVYHVICFTQANLQYAGDDVDVLHGVCPTWDLPLTFSNAPIDHTPADVAELADLIRETFGRPPFVVPQEGEL
jgi:hypothetical protein